MVKSLCCGWDCHSSSANFRKIIGVTHHGHYNILCFPVFHDKSQCCTMFDTEIVKILLTFDPKIKHSSVKSQIAYYDNDYGW